MLALGAILVVGLLSYVTARSYLERQAAVRETLASREAMVETLSLLKDAETGGRGFLLTGDEAFLEPYENARPKILADLEVVRRFAESDPEQHDRAERVNRLAREKLAIIAHYVELKRNGQKSADEVVPTLRHGKVIMDAIRVDVAQMLTRAGQHLEQREEETGDATLRHQLVLGALLVGSITLALAGLTSARRDAEQVRVTNEQLERDVAARKAAEAKLREQSALLESVLENIGDAVLVLDSTRTVLVANPAAQLIGPYRVGQHLTAAWSSEIETYTGDGKTPFAPEQGPLTRALLGHASDGVEMVMRVTSKELRSFTVTTRPIVEDGGAVAAVAVFHDTTAMKVASAAILENEQRYRILSEASFEGVAISDEGVIKDTNGNFAHWLGYEPAELVGVVGVSLFPPEEQERVRKASETAEVSYESRVMRRDGTTMPVEVRGRYAHFRNRLVRIAVIRDITERKQREAELLEKSEQLRALSLRDELTGLLNRRGFIEAAEHQLKSASRAGESCAVFFADLNGMKIINDQLGHDAGDDALRAAAKVLGSVFRSSDVVARLGGDEFAVFAGECTEENVPVVHDRVEQAVKALNAVSGAGYALSISAGAAVFTPGAPRDLVSLMQEADATMYEAKRARHKRPSLRVRSA
jgi:diguanylate cyclase (GGDEF)-like protein/PAS domain S-box-containing protein